MSFFVSLRVCPVWLVRVDYLYSLSCFFFFQRLGECLVLFLHSHSRCHVFVSRFVCSLAFWDWNSLRLAKQKLISGNVLLCLNCIFLLPGLSFCDSEQVSALLELLSCLHSAPSSSCLSFVFLSRGFSRFYFQTTFWSLAISSTVWSLL